jgi:hypothetical protein
MQFQDWERLKTLLIERFPTDDHCDDTERAGDRMMELKQGRHESKKKKTCLELRIFTTILIQR